MAASEKLAAIYAAKMRERPCSPEHPWSLVIEFDEFTPGSLSHQQTYRKSISLACSFLELGEDVLSICSTWLIPVIAQTEKLYAAVGGWSACLAHFLRVFLLSDLSIQNVGVCFKAPDGTVLTLYARLQWLHADGEGLQHALNITARKGIRPSSWQRVC